MERCAGERLCDVTAPRRRRRRRPQPGAARGARPRSLAPRSRPQPHTVPSVSIPLLALPRVSASLDIQ